jgi:hypothetical protein
MQVTISKTHGRDSRLHGVELLVNPALSSGRLSMDGGGRERDVKRRSDSSDAIIRELREAQNSTAAALSGKLLGTSQMLLYRLP